MTEEKQKKNKRLAFLTTVGIHGVMFLLMFFIIAWTPPDPPLGASGIQLNFGLDDVGSGDTQPDTPVGSGGKEQDEPEKKESQPTPPQEAEPQPVEEKTKVAEQPAEDKSESQLESPIATKEVKKEEIKPVEKPKEKVVDKPAEVKPKTDDKAVYNPNGQKANSTNKTGDGKEGQPGNEGNDKDKVGDKGDPRGVDKSAIYEGNPGNGNGGPGGSGGFGLQMSGWNWDAQPKTPALPDNQSGTVVFEVTVDDQGDIVNIDIIEKTLSSEAVKICRQEIEKRSFVRTAIGTIPPRSKGRVTFTLRLK